MDRAALFKDVRRVVVKVGTRVLLDDARALDRACIARLTDELIGLREKGLDVALVSSGAIGVGLHLLGLKERPTEIPELQAIAAVGQSALMHVYHELCAKRGYCVAQILLSNDDLEDRKRFLNIRNTLRALAAKKVLPVINENDTVSVDEIKFGDNDILSAHMTNLMEADLLVVLSDVDALYDRDPALSGAKRVETVDEVTPEIERLAGASASGLGRGGMVSKLRAAKVVTSAGEMMVLADGKTTSIASILAGAPVGTLFRSSKDRMELRKRWIAYNLKDAGFLTVDEGGAQAITRQGKSLLASGVKASEGTFEAGEAVVVRTADGRRVAKGLCNYSSEELKKIQGRHSREIVEILGYKSYDEVIHRDHLVIL